VDAFSAHAAPADPIGIFDSGVGGLSVLRVIRAELPAADLIYVADSAYTPYGDRPSEFVQQRAVSLVEFLLDRGVKAVVVACNTATAAAAATLRVRFAVPIVAMEPAVKPAAAQTRSGVVGVLATTRTLASARFLELVDAHGGGVQVIVQPCPGWVEQVERGEVEGDASRRLVERHLRPVLDRGADTLVLGCTHYPFLRPLIEQIAGPDVRVIDPAYAVVRELRRRLDLAGLLPAQGAPGRDAFWTTGDPARVGPVFRQLWGSDVLVQAVEGTGGDAADPPHTDISSHRRTE
jgi:glutamate racemase